MNVKVKTMAKTPPKKKEVKPKSTKQVEELPESETFRGIVRIAGKDIRGHVPLNHALLHVRGISHSLCIPVANVLSKELDLSPDIPVGELDDAMIEKIDAILTNLQNHGIPKFMLNRCGDRADGTDRHVIMTDLLFSLREDLESEKKLYTWKGYRHSYGQKVRGQRTRNTGRTGMAVGVRGAAAAPASKGGPAGGAAKPVEAKAAAPGMAAKPAAGKPAAAKPAAGKTAEKK
jgi:small subunit ribosomal protein S13